ncbi:hypothetical protein IQ231_03210 [Cuspidothrix issatschenkoi LEGE 03284]|uniref:hypothetical protein n=1 Tax=Cuspidothrix issatschenkoi TaxID=230752 RepID=UPI00187E5CC2|nr:hypothetical protein [Cuspidothrix issatschenkoi]MBE9230724.1 hypothetical protein [Cuspidothrix issatschenkoi LEGE 03284]
MLVSALAIADHRYVSLTKIAVVKVYYIKYKLGVIANRLNTPEIFNSFNQK